MLEPKTQQIPFTTGIDRSLDSNANSAAGFLQMDNCVFDQDGAVIGRPVLATQAKFGSTETGMFLRSADTLAVKDLSDGFSVTRFADIFPGQRVMSVEAATDATTGRYTCVVLSVLIEDESHAWYGTFTPTLFLALVDSDGSLLALKEVGTTLGTLVNPKVAALANVSYPCWAVTGVGSSSLNLVGSHVSWQNGAFVVGSPITIQSSLSGGFLSAHDLVTDGAIAYALYCTSAGVAWKSYASDGTSLILTITGSTYTLTGATNVWAEQRLVSGVSRLFVVAYCQTTLFNDTVTSAVWNTATGGFNSTQVLSNTETTPGALVILNALSGTTVLVAWNSATTTLKWVSVPTTTTSSTPLSPASYPDVMVASRASNGRFAAYSAASQNAGFPALDLVSLTSTSTAPLSVGRLAIDTAAPLHLFGGGNADDFSRFGYYQPRPFSPSGQTFTIFPLLVEEAAGDAQGSPVSTTGLVRRARLMKVASLATPNVATIGRLQLVAGSMPRSWDGIQLNPAGALMAPPDPSLGPGAAGALTGAYSVRTVVEFVDARGVSWFSPPSAPSSTVTLTAQKRSIGASINTRVMTAPSGKWKQYRLRVYSTIAGGSTYYYLASYVMDAAAFFGAGDSTISVSDNTTDAVLQQAEQLYSQSSDTFDLVPPLAHICAHGNRFFGVRSDVPEVVQFTDEVQEGFMPRWNALRSFRVDNGAGPALACGSLQDSLVVFQADQLCLVRGDGPTSSVADTTTFPVPQRFANVGVHPDRTGTIVTTGSGLFFVGRRNAYLIQPDLQVVPIGNALGGAQAWITGTFTYARYVSSRNQVWLFGTASGFTYGQPTVHVLDMNKMRWTTMSGMSTLSPAGWTTANDVADVLGTTYVVVGGSTGPFVFSLSETVDVAGNRFERRSNASTMDVPVVQTIDLPWFRADGTSQMRLRKVSIDGRKLHASGELPNITVKVFIQRSRSSLPSDTPVHTHAWTGSGTSVATDFSLTFRSISQRCSAFRVQIVITPTATSYPIALNTVTYMYGITGPSGKVQTGNLATAT